MCVGVMASVYAHPKSGILHVAFWYEGHQYRKSLKTRNRRQANEHAKAVQGAVNALKSGRDKEGLKLIRMGIPVLDVIFPTAKVKKMIEEAERKPLKLRDLHDKWIAHQVSEGRSDRTISTTKHRFVHFLRRFGDDFRVDYLLREDLDDYVAARRKDGIAEYTIGREIFMFKSIIGRAVELEWLSENPVRAWPKLKSESRKEFLPKDRVEELIATTELTDEEVEDLRSRMLLSAKDTGDLVALAEEKMPEMALPLALVAVTAIRRTEMVSVRRADLDTDKWTLTVESDKGSRKRKQVRRTIEIHHSVIPMVEAHMATLKRTDRLLFPVFARIGGKKRESEKDMPNRCDRAARLLQKLVDRIPWIMLKGWHTLRHSAISIYLDQGYSFDQIAKWTGHVDPETQKLYTHWFDTMARERMDKLPFEFNNGNGANGQDRHEEGSPQAFQMTPEQIEALIKENRALKAQIRKMEADLKPIRSLQRRVRTLEKRLDRT